MGKQKDEHVVFGIDFVDFTESEISLLKSPVRGIRINQTIIYFPIPIYFDRLDKEWTSSILDSKESAINATKYWTTPIIYYPTKSLNKFIGILREKFEKLIFGETDSGYLFIANIDNDNGIRRYLFWDEKGSSRFRMYCKK